MATHHGKNGSVSVGANAVAEVTNFSIEETVGTSEDTAMGDTAQSHKTNIPTWSASVTAHYDPADTTGQNALTIGASVTLNLYPEDGNSSGETEISGTALITRRAISSERDGINQIEFEAQGTGALTTGTV